MLQREPEADRRTVTVLFADLAGFTALAERLDPASAAFTLIRSGRSNSRDNAIVVIPRIPL